jgi:transcriptional regulator with XRE-family HTH domain
MAKVQTRFKKKTARHFIREWRKHRGLTLEALAERAGMTHGNLSQLERGVINYTQPALEALAKALDCEPADLIMRDPGSEVWSIMDSLLEAPADEQRRIIDVIAALRKTG